MEELLALRAAIKPQCYADMLILLGEMAEMIRKNKLYKIRSYIKILLANLIIK